MSKKKKTIKVMHVSSVENTLRQMPKYNGFATGHGVHKTPKHPSRAKRKHDFRKQISSFDY